MRRAIWTGLKLVLLLAVLAGGAAAFVILRSPDPTYAAYELAFHRDFHRYDDLIREVAKQRGMDPAVLKAVVWRESRFRPNKVGLDGEKGLMQITDAAAREWVKGEKVAKFAPDDLFDPKTNLEAGSWLLTRALRRYEVKDQPLPFALAEYNAGRRRVTRWLGDKDANDPDPNNGGVNSQELLARIDIASTKHYINTVQGRVKFYQARGSL